jgi:hypothetical protein
LIDGVRLTETHAAAAASNDDDDDDDDDNNELTSEHVLYN